MTKKLYMRYLVLKLKDIIDLTDLISMLNVTREELGEYVTIEQIAEDLLESIKEGKKHGKA